MKKLLSLLFISFCLVCNLHAQNYNFSNVMLLQSNEVLEKRCPDIKDLARYIKEVQTEISKYRIESNGFIVIAIRPYNKSNVWFDLENPDEKVLGKLKKKLTSIKTCDVSGDVLVFALTNYDGTKELNPMPPEWAEYLESAGYPEIEYQELIRRLWPPYITDSEKQELLKLISEFKKDTDFSDKNLKKYSYITDYAVNTDYLSVSINSKYWPKEVSKNKYGAMFLLAYIAGNIECQLLTGESENAPQAGVDFEFEKYTQLLEYDSSIKIKFFESMK